MTLALGLSACVAPAPCSKDSDCAAGRCENGACPAPVDTPDADQGQADLDRGQTDGRLSHRLAMNGPISALGRLGARAIFAVGDSPQIIGTNGIEAPVEVGRNAIAPRAIFALHDAAEFLMVVGAEWRSLVRYAMGEYVNLRPPPVDSDVRAVTRFRDGYLVYDLRNRRLRHYDANFAHRVVPGFDPDLRQFSVAGLLWLDRRRRLVMMQ